MRSCIGKSCAARSWMRSPSSRHGATPTCPTTHTGRMTSRWMRASSGRSRRIEISTIVQTRTKERNMKTQHSLWPGMKRNQLAVFQALEEAHDKLSELLEEPDVKLHPEQYPHIVHDAAVAVCLALNRVWEALR